MLYICLLIFSLLNPCREIKFELCFEQARSYASLSIVSEKR